MTIRVRSLDEDIWTVTPEGRIDVPAARSLEEALGGLLDEGHSRIAVDFSEATYIASGGLKTLLSALRRARALGGDLHLAAMGERVSDIFAMAGFDRVFTIHPTTHEAVQGLKKK